MIKPEARQWVDIAEGDFDSSLYLFEGARYPQAIYLLCQALEKILKAALIEFAGVTPQKIHRLENIAHDTGLSFSDSQYDMLTDLSKHYSRVRYPDISRVSYNSKEKVLPIMEKGKEMFQWITQQLKNR